MTDKRISPLQWLSTKFASLNHSHSEYLTSHQDITGKEDKSNKSSSIATDTGSTSKYTTVKAVEDYAQPKGNYLTQHQSLKTINNETITGTGNITIDTGSDIDIVTSWESTLSDEKVASEKLVKESIDSVLYETEELELGTPTTSSNVTYTYTRPYAEQPTSFTISTLNTIDLPSLPVGFRYGDYDYVVDITLPTNENSIFIFGGVYGATVFFDQYNPYQGIVLGGNNIGSISQCNPIGSSLQYRLIFRHIENDKYKVFFNDNNDTYREITIDDDLIEYSSNITISISARRINIPLKLSRYIDDIEQLEWLPDGSDLDFLTENKNYIGSNNEYSTISHCPVSNKNFFVKNIPLGEFGSGDIYQQTLITVNDGANTEVWVRTQIITGGYSGTWVKLATGNGSGGSVTVDSSWVANSTNPVQSQLIKTALDGKSSTSHIHDITEIISSDMWDNQVFSWDDTDNVMNIYGGLTIDPNQSRTLYNGNELATLYDLEETCVDIADFQALDNEVRYKEDPANKTSFWHNNPNHTYYPTEKLVKDSLDGKANSSHTHTTSDISDFPTIPSASSTTPSADSTNGSYGSGTDYARANHQHPKSSLYAEASHTHSNYVNPTIADNLTTNDSSQVLSAKQGKVLNDLIGQAISYINQ